MKYDDETRSLRLSSDEEISRFHDDLTELLRTATVSVTKDVDVEAATERARDLMKRHSTVLRCLNALRRSLPRHASTPDDEAPREPSPEEPSGEGPERA